MFRTLLTGRHLVSRRLWGTATVGSFLVLLASSVAVAAIPDSTGIIHGCYQQRTGDLRILDTNATGCRSDELAIQWNQTGPQGPAGPQGAPGPAGLAGSPLDFIVIAYCGSGTAGQLNNFGFVVGTLTSPVGTSCAADASFRLHQA